MTFVIVGGGPTGVEMAGALVELARHAIRHDFRRIDPTEAVILLVDAADSVLPAYPRKLPDEVPPRCGGWVSPSARGRR